MCPAWPHAQAHEGQVHKHAQYTTPFSDTLVPCFLKIIFVLFYLQMNQNLSTTVISSIKKVVFEHFVGI